MGYCNQTDIENRITAPRVTELSRPEGAAVVVPDIIRGADSDINLYDVDSWDADQLREASIAFAVESLYLRHPSGAVPEAHARRAEVWRLRLENAGQKSGKTGTWNAIAYDPTLLEGTRELLRLRTGR